VRERSQAVLKTIRASGRRASRVASITAASSLFPILTVLAIAGAAASGMSPPSKDAPSPPPGNMQVVGGASGGSMVAMVPAADAASPTAAAWPGPPETPPVDPATPTPSCLPGYDRECTTTPVPTPLPSITGPGRAFTVHVVILEYHRIKPDEGETGYVADLITPPNAFEAQMAAMYVAGWHTMTMGELGDDLRLGIQPRPKSFVVTLDDGWEDGYTYAFPILRRFGFVATYFVVGGQIGQPDHLTAGELRELLAADSEIGNHTMSHQDLRWMTPEQARAEIYDASALIARLIGVWPQSFSYPKGGRNAEVTAAVAATPGIETAVIQSGDWPPSWARRLEIPRMRVGPETLPRDLVAAATREQP
jgi:peptidoglycan/xylan/chitin deacetylase (PgdA/CDA1 family)